MKKKRIRWSDALKIIKTELDLEPEISLNKLSKRTGITWETSKRCVDVLREVGAIKRKRWIRCYVLHCNDSDCGHEIISPIGRKEAYCPICMHEIERRCPNIDKEYKKFMKEKP